MNKLLFLLLPLLNVNSCQVDDDYDDLFCWECTSQQEGAHWVDYFDYKSESFIDKLISDDRQDYPPIYTRCYKIECY